MDGTLVHPKIPSSIKFTGTYLYVVTWAESGTVKAQEHNTKSPARACTGTAQSGDKDTSNEASVPPEDKMKAITLAIF